MINKLKALQKHLETMSLEEDVFKAVSAAVAGSINDSRLTAAVEKYYNLLFSGEKEHGREISEWSDPLADELLGDSMIFTVVLFVRAFTLVTEKAYVYNGEAVDFFAPLLRHLGVNIKRNGSFGFKSVQRFWAYCYLKPIAFQLGRLAFEIMDYNYGYEVYLNPGTGESHPVALPGQRFDEKGLPDGEGSFETTFSADGDTVSGYTYTEEGTLDFRMKTLKGYKRVLKQGDKVVAVHMPGNAKLSEEAVSASLDGAEKFFDKYFPDLDCKAFVSSSWLLDTGLRNILKEDSNIVKLQKKFRIALAFKNDFSLFDNVFEVPKCPIEELVPQNRFQTEILNMIKSGRALYSGRGYILK